MIPEGNPVEAGRTVSLKMLLAARSSTGRDCHMTYTHAKSLYYIVLQRKAAAEKDKKADSTLRSSQAVPHPSTNRALCHLTSEVRRDPVHWTRYGRQRQCHFRLINERAFAGTYFPIFLIYTSQNSSQSPKKSKYSKYAQPN